MKYFPTALFILLCLSFELSVAQQKGKPSKNFYEKGLIEKGYKVGIWEYYDRPGEHSLTVDYSSGEITFMKKDTAGLYAIQKDGTWTASALDVQPRYVGSMSEFYVIMQRNIRFPEIAKQKGTSGMVYISFEIDTNGRAENFSAVSDIGDGCAEEVIRALKLVPNFWVVASKGGVAYRSRFVLPVAFNVSSPRNHVNIKEPELIVATMLDRVVIATSVIRVRSYGSSR